MIIRNVYFYKHNTNLTRGMFLVDQVCVYVMKVHCSSVITAKTTLQFFTFIFPSSVAAH